MTAFWPVVPHAKKVTPAERNAQEREAQKREQEERAAKKLAAKEWEDLRAQVLADEDAAAKVRAAEQAKLAAMTPQQLAAHYAERGTQIPERATARPKFYYTAKEEIEHERRETEREERERRARDLGVTGWDVRVQEISEARDTAIQNARDRCSESEQAAHERAETELAELGARPTLEAIEVTV